jgi:hypothetical protein
VRGVLLPGHLLRCRPERTVFALVASRALAPFGKLAAAGRVAGDVHIDGLSQPSDGACYRAMDDLHAMEAGFGKKVHGNLVSLASLVNLEADLLFRHGLCVF